MKFLEYYPFKEDKGITNKNLFFIAGPCVIETEKICLKVAEKLAEVANTFKIFIIFKASFDKANRTSINSYRGPGIKKGLNILKKIKEKTSLPVLTDIHLPEQAEEVSQVADVIQIPAFLCRQTDLLVSAAKTKKIVNIKKGQFMSPQDMKFSIEKAGKRVWLTERGTFFGYNRLVVDFTSIPVLKTFGTPVVFDATHSVQIPGGGNGCSLGNREYAIPLAKAAVCMGADGLFFEVHPTPQKALCDRDNTISLKDFIENVPLFLELYNKFR
jgi:2-dehydro-3-deoxyphosphooctonate aldolase (KDO 8-P synthase)